MTTTADPTTIADRYLAAYGEPDAATRARLIEAVWAPDARLVDPPLVGEGHAGIDQAAEALQSQFPGHRFRRTSGVDAHHEHLRFAWELVGPDGAVAVAGTDIGTLDAHGRLHRVVGFFGDLPAREAA